MSVEFIELISTVICSRGDLFVATDSWAYASMVIDNSRQVSSLMNMGAPYFTTIDHIDYYSPSFFEQKWRDEGRTIYYMRFRKS
jgi:tRNA G46 methylase TrmB